MEKINEEEVTKIANNCRRATFLIEKQQTEKITLKEKWELQLHLKSCEICSIFMKQSGLINQFAKKVLGSSYKELKLEDAFKKQLQMQIDRKLDKH